MDKYKVYVKVNELGYIIEVNSSAFLKNFSGWTEIDSGYSDKYHHAQGNYFQKHIITDGGAYCYRMSDGIVAECTAEEIAEQELNNQITPTPSQLDIIEAQVTYTAMMTDTLLEV